VAGLDGVTADLAEMVEGDRAAGIARRCVQGMRPDAVAADVRQVAFDDAEIGGSFFEQDAPVELLRPRGLREPLSATVTRRYRPSARG